MMVDRDRSDEILMPQGSTILLCGYLFELELNRA
jgi:hypothetical protein